MSLLRKSNSDTSFSSSPTLTYGNFFLHFSLYNSNIKHLLLTTKNTLFIKNRSLFFFSSQLKVFFLKKEWTLKFLFRNVPVISWIGIDNWKYSYSDWHRISGYTCSCTLGTFVDLSWSKTFSYNNRAQSCLIIDILIGSELNE